MTADERTPNPAQVLGLLAVEQRLRVFAALVLGARSSSEVAGRAGTSMRETVRALAQLQRGGLVSRSGEGWAAHPEVLREAVIAAAPEEKPEDHGAADPAEAAVLRAFLRGGRLTALPAAWGKRRVVLDHLARAFEPGVRYTEREVNAILRAFHDDHATLRRYLVDEGFLTRESGEYWRTGGTVEV